MALGMALIFKKKMSQKGQTKSQKVCGLLPTFVEVTGEKLIGGTF